MAEQDTQYKGKLKETGIFDFKEFYEFVYDWLVGEGYKVFERAYKEKISGDSKDLEIVWENDRKVSDYFKFRIKMEWKVFGLKKVEVKKEDKKIMMNSGEIEIKFAGIIMKDYENRWENHPFWKFLRGVYDKYIIRSRVDEYEGKVEEETRELITQCKAFLALESRKI